MKHCIAVWIAFAILILMGCTSSTTISSRDDKEVEAHCTEPENPYDEDSGHHAGYEWAEDKDPGVCGGSSNSFVEGCEEYQRQETEYEECQAGKER